MHNTHKIGGLLIAFALVACNSKPEVVEPTLETECPQVASVKTKIVDSDLSGANEDTITISVIGTLMPGDRGLLDVTTKLIDQATLRDRPKVRINIDSNGGALAQGLALRDAVKYYGEDHISILCTTDASSAASFLFATAARRYALPSCGMITHAVSVAHDANVKPDLNMQRDFLKKENMGTQQIRDIYRASLGLTEGCAMFLTRRSDTDLTAYDALKLGFFDAVLEPNGKMTVRVDFDLK